MMCEVKILYNFHSLNKSYYVNKSSSTFLSLFKMICLRDLGALCFVLWSLFLSASFSKLPLGCFVLKIKV